MTLDFGSGHDPTAREFEPRVGLYKDSTKPAWDSLCPLSAPPPAFALSLCQTPRQPEAAKPSRSALHAQTHTWDPTEWRGKPVQIL